MLQQTEVQKLLKQLADERFSEASNHSSNVNLVDKSRKVKVKIKQYIF